MKNYRSYLQIKILWMSILLISLLNGHVNSQSLVYKTTVNPTVNGAGYTHIAVGDIVGPSGTRAQNSMNLSDNLTTSLMAKGSHEILDRNVLTQLAKSGSPNGSIVDESIVTSIGEQYQSAVLILGRIQSESIQQQLEKVPQSIVVNGCNTEYYYKSTGNFVLQLRILDAKTAKLIHAEAITVPMAFESQRKCEVPGKLNEDEIISKSIAKMTEEVLNRLFAYELNEPLYFQKPLIANPFKDLDAVMTNFQMGNETKGLNILKGYLSSPDIKEKFKPLAYFNYAIGLLAANQFQSALDNFNQAFDLRPSDAASVQMIKFTKEEMTRRELSLNN